jgi:hypothetical protein
VRKHLPAKELKPACILEFYEALKRRSSTPRNSV